jgi:D-psicose/D-tagatose/L-ribulose 3-epimerase
MNLTRRAALSSLALAALGSPGPSPYRFAICNETFQGKPFAETCRLAKTTGYQGLEIAPGTLSGDPAALSPSQRAGFRRAITDNGLRYTGLHAVVSVPPGLHLTTPDTALRDKSWQYFRRLIDLSADLGDNGVMVLGSGKQRGAVDGSTVADATKRLRDGLAGIAPHARTRGVLVLLEPLSPKFTNVVNSLAEALEVVREIGSPSVDMMFDTHNTVAETAPHDQLIRKYAKHIRHVHLNEMDGRHPGTGTYDFGLVLRTLREVGYTGWVSLEVFQFQPSGEVIAKETMALLRRMTGK